MEVLHEPVKDRDVAVYGYVDVVQSLLLREILLEVLHVVEKESFVTFEVLRLLLGLIAHMDQDLVTGCRGVSSVNWGSGRGR